MHVLAGPPLKFLFRNVRVKQLSSCVLLFPLALPTDLPSCFTVSNKQWETPCVYFVHNRCPNGAFIGFVCFFALQDEPFTILDFLSCSVFYSPTAQEVDSHERLPDLFIFSHQLLLLWFHMKWVTEISSAGTCDAGVMSPPYNESRGRLPGAE